MPTSDQFSVVKKLVEGFRLPVAEHRLRSVTIPLSVIVAVVRSSLETSPFFPPDIRPEELGDGAVIERLGDHHFRVHERFEVGQLRFSELSSHSYFFLRSALLRYLKHYRTLLRVDGVHIKEWS
jgi:hypothetical protein